MLVADTSALLWLATGGVLETALDEFDVHTTETVVEELEETSDYDDVHGDAAETVLGYLDRLTVHETDDRSFTTSRVGGGEGSCVELAADIDAEFLLTDDLRALPELQNLVDAEVAISPIVLRALVNRGALDAPEAEDRLARIARNRDWLGAPIYRRAQQLFD